MRRYRVPITVSATALALVLAADAGGGIRPADASVTGPVTDPTGGTGSYLLTATSTGPTYAPTFTGNGELGLRVPPTGQGYAGGAVPTQAELAGFYAQPPGGVQQRANIPVWSTLTFSDGGQSFSLSSGHTSNWRQSINLRTGVIGTAARWTAPSGHVTELSYQVLTDRARAHIGIVRLTLMPRWTGTAAISDTIDGASATLSTETAKAWIPSVHREWIAVEALGTNIEAVIASQLTMSDNVVASTTQLDRTVDQSVGQQLAFHVTAGHRYTLTKYVGVVTSLDSDSPTLAAQTQASDAAATGFSALLAANDTEWTALWSGRIDVLGNQVLATELNASEFYLWSSIRDGVDWSISPAGLSSNGYNGHIFWDAETWMYPALLAQHPDLAEGMDNYRFGRLAAAHSHASATGYLGSRFPWESALDGTEQIPPPASLFTEGLYEQHVTADIALAQWQYYEATGNKRWLAQHGWPVISQAATFWASRVVAGAGGSYHIDGITGPDEENADVDDEVYTNAAAAATLRDAIEAARLLGLKAPADWARIASGIVVPTDRSPGITPEFAGYGGQLIKQADATLLEYPLGRPISPSIAQGNVDYYVPRTDPGGPSMSDAISSIDTSMSGTAGCASFVFTQRSAQPFIRDVFDQFSETKTGGVFTFMTGIGGFLQEFLYGYSGLQWNADAVQLSPILTGQLGGLVLHGLWWHGRRFTVTIDQHATAITLNSGGVLPVKTGSVIRGVGTGQTLSVATRRPDLVQTKDVARCGDASATSSQPGAPALAAVDGSAATEWRPMAIPAMLTVRFPHGARTVSSATLTWSQQWPPAPAPNVSPPPGPVTTPRASDYNLATSIDGTTWQPVTTVMDRTSGSIDVLHFSATKARYVRVTINSSTDMQSPGLDQLTVTG